MGRGAVVSGVSGQAGTQTDFDPRNNPADAQQLAEQYAPILVLPEGENHNLPANPQEFIDNSELREHKTAWFDESHGNNTDRNSGNDFNGGDFANPESDGLFLDLDNNQREQLGRTQDRPAQLNYETDFTTNPPTITYHVFYAYNDGPGPQNHEGDFERITLELNPHTLEPETALYNAHEHVNVANYDDVADPVTNRPVVYVAAGTHAGHAEAGEHGTEVPLITESTVSNPGNRAPIRDLEDAVIYENWGELVDVTQQDWYTNEAGNDGVRWGEIGETTFTSGPHGPSLEKGALQNPEREVDDRSWFERLDDFVSPFTPSVWRHER